MEEDNRPFGPLTIGVALGASIGLAVAAFGLYVLEAGGSDNDYDSNLIGSVMRSADRFSSGLRSRVFAIASQARGKTVDKVPSFGQSHFALYPMPCWLCRFANSAMTS